MDEACMDTCQSNPFLFTRKVRKIAYFFENFLFEYLGFTGAFLKLAFNPRKRLKSSGLDGEHS